MQSPWINKAKRKQDLITVVTLLSGVTGGRGKFHNEELHTFYCFQISLCL